MGYVKAADAVELAPGGSMLVKAGGKRIALFNVDGTFHAIDDTCTHRGGPLSDGPLEGGVVTCPWHGARFDVTNGRALTPPAPRGVSRYPVRITNGSVEIDV